MIASRAPLGVQLGVQCLDQETSQHADQEVRLEVDHQQTPGKDPSAK